MLAGAGTAAAGSSRSPHPRKFARPSFLEISPAVGPAGTVVTIHAYCGSTVTSFGLSFLVPPTGPAVPGQLQPTEEAPATVENSGPGGQALPVPGYPAGTWLATVKVLAGLPPGMYPIALDCNQGPALTKPFTIPGPGAGLPVFGYSLAVFQYLIGNYLQKVPVYTGPGSTPGSIVPNTSPGTLPVPPTHTALPTTTTTRPTSTTSSSTTTTTCVRTRGHLCP